MTRRLLAAALFAALAGGGLVGTSASATEDNALCIGGENQRKPGQQNMGICVGRLLDIGHG